jgi:hypothetical protein
MPDLTTVARVKEWLGGIPNGEILEGTVDPGGTGYHPATTTVSLAGVIGSGSGFEAVPVIVGGVIQPSLVILNPGSLYLKGTPPTVVFTDTDVSPGSGAQASLNIASIDGAADALLAHLVSAASAFFLQRCSRLALIGPVTVIEKRNGNPGQRQLILFEAPVTGVNYLKIDGNAQAASSAPFNPGFGFDADGVFLRGMAFTGGFGNIEISYTAGYDANSSEAAMIEQAVIELVGTKYRRRTHIDEVSRALSASGSITVSFSQKDVPAEVQAAIDKFSRPMVFGG